MLRPDAIAKNWINSLSDAHYAMKDVVIYERGRK